VNCDDTALIKTHLAQFWWVLIVTTKTNPKIETSAQNMKTSESASFTRFPSQILAAWLDSQYLDSYREVGKVRLQL
jgi:hypothetical protein